MATIRQRTLAAIEGMVRMVLENDSQSNYDDADAVGESVQSELDAKCDDLSELDVARIGELCEDWFNAEPQDEVSEDEDD